MSFSHSSSLIDVSLSLQRLISCHFASCQIYVAVRVGVQRGIVGLMVVWRWYGCSFCIEIISFPTLEQWLTEWCVSLTPKSDFIPHCFLLHLCMTGRTGVKRRVSACFGAVWSGMWKHINRAEWHASITWLADFMRFNFLPGLGRTEGEQSCRLEGSLKQHGDALFTRTIK